MLGGGTAAQAAFSAIGIGLPAIAPALRDEFGLTLTEVGLVLAAEWIGLTFTLLGWGLVADRVGERRALGVGMTLCGAFLWAAASVSGLAALVVLLALAGAAGGAVQSASGRAVMHWFAAEERGLALGLRQTAVPIGGLVGALALPAAVQAGGVRAAFLLLGGLCIGGALVGVLLIRDRADAALPVDDVPWTLADRRLWLLCSASGLYLSAQLAVFGYAVLFLVDERGFSNGRAALVLAGVQAAGAVLRIAAGRWSDRLGQRVVPLRRIGLAAAGMLVLAAALLDAPAPLLVAVFVLAGGVSMAWNGLSYTAAAELAGPRRSGAAIGFQQTVLSVAGVAVPVAFAAVVSAASWRTAFALSAAGPLAGWAALRPLAERGGRQPGSPEA